MRYPLASLVYPKKWPDSPQGWNLDAGGVTMWAVHLAPKGWRWERSAHHLNHSSKGVMLGGMELCGSRCFMWVAARTAKGQKKSRRFASMSMARAMLQMVQFVRLATLFWAGESGTVFSYKIPWFLQCKWRSP